MCRYDFLYYTLLPCKYIKIDSNLFLAFNITYTRFFIYKKYKNYLIRKIIQIIRGFDVTSDHGNHIIEGVC